MNIFFTSDTHFWHKGVIEHAKRPFKDVDEMNEALIANWNKRVKDDDHIYFLGDFSFAAKTKTEAILCRLNGKKYFIRGNHDKAFTDEWLLKYFIWVKDYYTLKVQDGEGLQRIVLFHYALRTWDMIHYGAWHLFGHSHGNMKLQIMPSMDVGTDCHSYAPISYEEVKAKLKDIPYTVTDHHYRQEGKPNEPV